MFLAFAQYFHKISWSCFPLLFCSRYYSATARLYISAHFAPLKIYSISAYTMVTWLFCLILGAPHGDLIIFAWQLVSYASMTTLLRSSISVFRPRFVPDITAHLQMSHVIVLDRSPNLGIPYSFVYFRVALNVASDYSVIRHRGPARSLEYSLELCLIPLPWCWSRILACSLHYTFLTHTWKVSTFIFNWCCCFLSCNYWGKHRVRGAMVVSFFGRLHQAND